MLADKSEYSFTIMKYSDVSGEFIYTDSDDKDSDGKRNIYNDF